MFKKGSNVHKNKPLCLPSHIHNIEGQVIPMLGGTNSVMEDNSIAKDCLLTGQEQACTRITRLFGCSVITMPKMTQYTGKWLPPSDHIHS